MRCCYIHMYMRTLILHMYVCVYVFIYNIDIYKCMYILVYKHIYLWMYVHIISMYMVMLWYIKLARDLKYFCLCKFIK